MTRSKRRIALAAAATALGVGGVLFSGASAMAATPGQSAIAAAPAFQSTAGTAATSTPSTEHDDHHYCIWEEPGEGVCLYR